MLLKNWSGCVMVFKNLDSLFDYIENDIQDVMEHEVSAVVEEKLHDHVSSDVYGVYTPKYYLRRMATGGMLDYANIDAKVERDGREIKLTVRNVTPLDNKKTNYDLDEIVVKGYGNQPFPRDFYQNTIEDLIETKDCVRALKKGLKGKGYKVK